MILKVLIIFDPKLILFKSDTYIFMQQSRSDVKIVIDQVNSPLTSNTKRSKRIYHQYYQVSCSSKSTSSSYDSGANFSVIVMTFHPHFFFLLSKFITA